MSAVATDRPLGAPYVSWGTLENLWERLDKDGLPPKIDRSILGGSEGYKTQMLAGLKWLGLIDPDGKVTPRMEQFIDEPARRQELVAQLFREKYAKQIELGENNASQRDLELSFQPLTGNTARKAVSFYLKGAKFADLPLSSYFITPRVRKPNTGTKRTAVGKKGKKGAANEDSSSVEINLDGLHPSLANLLRDLPRDGRGWTDEERSQFKTVWDTMLDYSIPVVESHDDEDNELQEDDDE
jgi:hypothetical protein